MIKEGVVDAAVVHFDTKGGIFHANPTNESILRKVLGVLQKKWDHTNVLRKGKNIYRLEIRCCVIWWKDVMFCLVRFRRLIKLSLCTTHVYLLLYVAQDDGLFSSSATIESQRVRHCIVCYYQDKNKKRSAVENLRGGRVR